MTIEEKTTYTATSLLNAPMRAAEIDFDALTNHENRGE